MTGGRGRFIAEHSHYDPVPAHLVEKVSANAGTNPRISGRSHRLFGANDAYPRSRSRSRISVSSTTSSLASGVLAFVAFALADRLQPLERLDHHEDRGRDDEEVGDVGEEVAVGHGALADADAPLAFVVVTAAQVQRRGC